jgi:hypothetical protein
LLVDSIAEARIGRNRSALQEVEAQSRSRCSGAGDVASSGRARRLGLVGMEVEDALQAADPQHVAEDRVEAGDRKLTLEGGGSLRRNP